METTPDLNLKVHLAFDAECGRWYVSESDVPGLRLEADSPAILISRIQDVASELIEANWAEICSLHDQASKQMVRIIPVFDSPLGMAT
jgi:Domain of unknown function (DUF1902)